jgi:hypothetical protein
LDKRPAALEPLACVAEHVDEPCGPVELVKTISASARISRSRPMMPSSMAQLLHQAGKG